MELLFSKNVYHCLRNVVQQMQTQEQTQELRLTDGMPDIGRVLGCWGQPVIRGKEWRSSGMNVSGGVMIWVLYAPEDGSQPRTMESWIPFQMKWDFGETQRDGTILVTPYLRSIDCRTISARKVMVRANIAVDGEALEHAEAEGYQPQEVPNGLQLLQRTYPMMLPKEAGEKAFQIEEILAMPDNLPKIANIVRYELIPTVKEMKVLAGRLIFRGSCKLKLLYQCQEGELHSWETSVAFSQFVDLDHDYTTNAAADIRLIVTGLELAAGEELKLLCGISAQYMIFDREDIQVVEDAYFPHKQVDLQMQSLKIPSLLDVNENSMKLTISVPDDTQEIEDAWVAWDHPSILKEDDTADITLAGQMHILYKDTDGALQSVTAQSEDTWNLTCDGNNRIRIDLQPEIPAAEGMGISAYASVAAHISTLQEIPMVTGLQITDKEDSGKEKPSLILCRVGERGLWEIAKHYDSTVDDIRSINQLNQEPLQDSYILIPIA